MQHEALPPIARHLTTLKKNSDKAVPILFLSGAQGAGKSTLARQLADDKDLDVLCLGLDDFYLTRSQRQKLARDVSPLFETRGAPGTHDMAMLNEVIASLENASPKNPVLVPRFDKVKDDRAPKDEWLRIERRPQCLMIEGWLLGAKADFTSLNEPPLNAVEQRDEKDKRHPRAWRTYQEDQLAGPYNALWSGHPVAYLLAPSFERILDWRIEQEKDNMGKAGRRWAEEDAARIATFVQYYERLTRRIISGNREAGLTIRLNNQRRLLSTR